MRNSIALPLLSALILLAGCGEGPLTARPAEAVYEIAVAGERFHVRLSRAPAIEAAERLIRSGGATNLNGELARGDGGFNPPFSWHLEPASVEFVDVTIEVCDGLPSEVERELEYWLEAVGRYCPWDARVVRRVTP